MPKLRFIKRWPGPLRLLLLFVACVLLSGAGAMAKDWLTYTRTTVTPHLVYHLSGFIVGAIIVPVILIGLSWSEQRFFHGMSEAIVATAGVMITAVFIRLGLGIGIATTRDLILGMLGILVYYSIIRALSLWFVRSLVCRCVIQDTCSACGYSLIGNTSGVCPECGERL